MTYQAHFKHADDVIYHLDNEVIPHIKDDLLKQKYIGFVTVTGVTVYELAIKDIFINFAYKKNKVFGNFIQAYFDRINGKIKIDQIKGEHIKKFGDKYLNKFKHKLISENDTYLRIHGNDICSSYNNFITWRHQYSHGGRVPSSTTFNEVVNAYICGKKVIECLNHAMYR